MDPILNDKRFAKLATDKKFRSVGKKHKKVKIDKRFGSLFTDKNFVSKCSVCRVCCALSIGSQVETCRPPSTAVISDYVQVCFRLQMRL